MKNLLTTQMELAADNLASAMHEDDLHKHFFPDEESRHRKLAALYRFKLKNQQRDTFVSSELLEAIAVWEKPFTHHNGVSFTELLRGLRLPFVCGFMATLRMLKYQCWASKTRQELIRDPYWYLDVVIVTTLYQGKGFASLMIRPFLARAEADNACVYLETQNPRNIRIYERLGFELALTATLPNTAITQFCMIRRSPSVTPHS